LYAASAALTAVAVGCGGGADERIVRVRVVDPGFGDAARREACTRLARMAFAHLR
jgi:hypothetical protein